MEGSPSHPIVLEDEPGPVPRPPSLASALELPPLAMDVIEESEIEYQPNYKTVTEAGRSKMNRFCDNAAELVDNAVQATRPTKDQTIEGAAAASASVAQQRLVRLILVKALPCWRMLVWDSGKGMDIHGLRKFATFHLTEADRQAQAAAGGAAGGSGIEEEGFISKYGVGAKEAGFNLSPRIRIVTKTKASPNVWEFVMDAEEMERRSRAGLPVFRDSAKQRRIGGLSEPRRAGETLAEWELRKEEMGKESFTCVSLELRPDRWGTYLEQAGPQALLQELGRIYFFHTRPDELPEAVKDWGVCRGGVVDIQVEVRDETVTGGSSVAMPPMSLCEDTSNLTSRLLTTKQAEFPFSFWQRNPDYSPNKLELRGKEWLPVHGVVYYYPFIDAVETNPRQLGVARPADDEEVEDVTAGRMAAPEPPVSVFWQGRFVPETSAMDLPFFPSKDQMTSSRFRDDVGASWPERIHTTLHYNWFFPISDNKLKLLLGANPSHASLYGALLDPNNVRFDPDFRSLKTRFKNWLSKCHKTLDKETEFSGLLQEAGDKASWSRVRFTSSGEEFQVDARIRLGRKKYRYGTIVRFESDANNMRGRDLPNAERTATDRGDGRVVFRRHPPEKYGTTEEIADLRELVPGKAHVPDALWDRVMGDERQGLPSTLCVQYEEGRRWAPLPEGQELRLTAGEASSMLRLRISVLDSKNRSVTQHWANKGDLMLRREIFQLQAGGAGGASSVGGGTTLTDKDVKSSYTVFEPHALVLAGRYALKLSLLDGSNTNLPRVEWPIVVEAGTPAAAQIDVDEPVSVFEEDEAPSKLPAFRVVAADAHGNDCQPRQLTVNVVSADNAFDVKHRDGRAGPHSGGRCEQGDWLAMPRRRVLLSASQPATETYIFAVTVTWDGGASSEPIPMPIKFMPGKPVQLAVLAPVEKSGTEAAPLFEVRNFDELPPLVFAALDANGNRVDGNYGGGVRLELTVEGENGSYSSPLEGCTKTPLDEKGLVTFRAIKASFGVLTGSEGRIFRVTATLRSVSSVSSKRRRTDKGKGKQPAFAATAAVEDDEDLCSRRFSFRLLPSTEPFKAVVVFDGKSWPSGEAQFRQIAGAVVRGLRLEYRDQCGCHVAITSGLFKKGVQGIRLSWALDWNWEAAMAPDGGSGGVSSLPLPPMHMPTDVHAASILPNVREREVTFTVATTLTNGSRALDLDAMTLRVGAGPPFMWAAAPTNDLSAAMDWRQPEPPPAVAHINGYVDIPPGRIWAGEPCGTGLMQLFGVVYLADEFGNRATNLPGQQPPPPTLSLEGLEPNTAIVEPEQMLLARGRGPNVYQFPPKLVVAGVAQQPAVGSRRNVWLVVSGKAVDPRFATHEAIGAAAAESAPEPKELHLPLQLWPGTVASIELSLPSLGIKDWGDRIEAAGVASGDKVSGMRVRFMDQYGCPAFIPNEGVELELRLGEVGGGHPKKLPGFRVYDVDASLKPFQLPKKGRAGSSGVHVLSVQVVSVGNNKPPRQLTAELKLRLRKSNRVVALIVRAVADADVSRRLHELATPRNAALDLSAISRVLAAIENDVEGPAGGAAAAAAPAEPAAAVGNASANQCSIFAGVRAPTNRIDQPLPSLVIWAVTGDGTPMPLQLGENVHVSVIGPGRHSRNLIVDQTHTALPGTGAGGVAGAGRVLVLAGRSGFVPELGAYEFHIAYPSRPKVGADSRVAAVMPAAAAAVAPESAEGQVSTSIELLTTVGRPATLCPERSVPLAAGARNRPGSTEEALKARRICGPICFGARDVSGNKVPAGDVRGPLKATILPAGGSAATEAENWPRLQGAEPDGYLYAAGGNMLVFDGGLVLAPGAGAVGGDYEVVVSSQTPADGREWRHRFTFSTNAEEQQRVEARERQLEPLRARRDELHHSLQEAQLAVAMAEQALDASIGALPEAIQAQFGDSLAACRQTAANNQRALSDEIRDLQRHAPRATEYNVATHTQILTRMQGLAPLGWVFSAAYVDELQLARVLSWAGGSERIGAPVMATAADRSAVASRNVTAYALDSIPRYSGGVTDDGKLNLPACGAPGFLGYAVNLLDLAEGFSAWRSSVYWAVYKKSMIFDTNLNAANFQKTEARSGRATASIFTMEGTLLDGWGLEAGRRMDTKALRYVFGQRPLAPEVARRDALRQRYGKVLDAATACEEAKERQREAQRLAEQGGLSALEEQIAQLSGSPGGSGSRGGGGERGGGGGGSSAMRSGQPSPGRPRHASPSLLELSAAAAGFVPGSGGGSSDGRRSGGGSGGGSGSSSLAREARESSREEWELEVKSQRRAREADSKK